MRPDDESGTTPGAPTGDAGASPRTMIFTGHARLPQALGGRFGSTVVSVEVEVDPASGQIVDASCYPVPQLTERLVRSILCGRNLQDGLDAAVLELQRRYICPSQRAIATAVTNVYETYVRWKTAAPATPVPARRVAESASPRWSPEQ